jgi:hypothetical protein
MNQIVNKLASLASTAIDWSEAGISELAKRLDYGIGTSTISGRYTRIDFISPPGQEYGYAVLLDKLPVTVSFIIGNFARGISGRDVSNSASIREASYSMFDETVKEAVKVLGPTNFFGTPTAPGYPPDHSASCIALWNKLAFRIMVYWDYAEDEQPVVVGVSLGNPVVAQTRANGDCL